MKPMLRKRNLPLFSENWLSDFFQSDRFFDADWLNGFQQVPAVNVMEKEKEFEIQMAAPGLAKKDFTITVENGILTIEVEKDTDKEEKLENYTRREYSYTNFSRSFTLPENVKADKVDAWYENGVLRLVLPKLVEAQVKPKAIEVH